MGQRTLSFGTNESRITSLLTQSLQQRTEANLPMATFVVNKFVSDKGFVYVNLPKRLGWQTQ